MHGSHRVEIEVTGAEAAGRIGSLGRRRRRQGHPRQGQVTEFFSDHPWQVTQNVRYTQESL